MCDIEQDMLHYEPGRIETHEEWLNRRKLISNAEYEQHKERLRILNSTRESVKEKLLQQLQKTQIKDKIVTVDNFFKATIGTFDEIDNVPEGYECIFNSKSSIYYVNPEKTKIVRVSDHWGWGIRFCVWFLRGYEQQSARKWIKNHGPKMRVGIIEIKNLSIHKRNQVKAIEWYNKRDQNI